MKKACLLVVVWIVSMFATGMWASAQAPLPSPAPRLPGGPTEPPTVISGNDLGFRVEDLRNRRVLGRFVVRVNGQWLEVEEASVTKRLTAR